MNKSIRWIVFDLGGVVINVNFENFFTALPAELHDQIAKNREQLVSIFREYETRAGREIPEQVFDTIRSLLGSQVSDQHLITAINSMLGSPIQKVCDVIEVLSKTYSIACLSNTNYIHWEYLLSNYPIMKKFEVQIASHLIGAAKPNPEIYRRAQTLLHAQASELLFFDDKPENIDSARQLGWNGAVFNGVDGFIDDCKRFDVWE